MADITRLHVGPRMSQAVIHGDMVYLAGQVGETGTTTGEQTREILASIDALLAEAGTDKTRILTATIWLADIADFAEMNAEWERWVPAGHTPARATGQVPLAAPKYRVEIIVVATR